MKRIAVIGMGGFAADHHRAVLRLQERGLARLVATCDPKPGEFSAQSQEWRLRERGVTIFDDYRKLLQHCGGELDILSVPTPVPLHAEMHRAGIEAGLAVYLEKPPTLDVVEFEQMLAVEQRAAYATLVGMNFMLESERLALKQRLLSGEFGRLECVGFFGLWPRSSAYYARNGWAGRLRIGEKLILDSCLGNAMAHHAHALLFWAGTDALGARASVRRARARLARAHRIEGADTCFVEADTTTGVALRFAGTHATRAEPTQAETLFTEKAIIQYEVDREWEVLWRTGRREQGELHYPDVVLDNYLAYLDYLRGGRARPPTTLEDTRGFVALNASAYVSSAAIADFPEPRVARARGEHGEEYCAVQGLDDALRTFADEGFTDADSASPWVTPEELDRLPGVIEQILARVH